MALIATAVVQERALLLRRNNRPDRRGAKALEWQHWPDFTCQADDPVLESLQCTYPDLEDEGLLDWGLRKSTSEGASGDGIKINVLHGSNDNLEWSENVDDAKLEELLQPPAPALLFCFINTLDSGKSWLPGNFGARPQTIRILHKAGLSGVLLCNLYSEHSYWAKMGNQRHMRYEKRDDKSKKDENGEENKEDENDEESKEDEKNNNDEKIRTDEEGRYDKKNKLKSFEVCYQYRCGLDTGVSFIHTKRSKQNITYFCINYPCGALDRLKAIVNRKDRREVLSRHFFLDSLAADDSLKQWQFDIGQKRVELFGVEKTLEQTRQGDRKDKSATKRDAKGLSATNHVMKSLWGRLSNRKKKNDEEEPAARNREPQEHNGTTVYDERPDQPTQPNDINQEVDFDNVTHDLHDMVRHWLGLKQDCEDLLAQLSFLHDTYMMICEKMGSDWPMEQEINAGETFEVLKSQCDICVRWTQVYYDRVKTRIGLLFHLANQRTAADTARIAVQTQRDSASMITIAAVTLVFLPGTFVCTIISTNLFDFGEKGLQASRQWWILLAIALPLTVIVLAVWEGWRRWRVGEHEQEAKKTASDMKTYGVSMSRRSTGMGLTGVQGGRGGARRGKGVGVVPVNRSHQLSTQQHIPDAHQPRKI